MTCHVCMVEGCSSTQMQEGSFQGCSWILLNITEETEEPTTAGGMQVNRKPDKRVQENQCVYSVHWENYKWMTAGVMITNGIQVVSE